MMIESLLVVGIVLAATVLSKLLWKISEFPDFLKMEIKQPSLRERECVGPVPLLSVIIPANNEESNVEKAARSVLASECSDLELILVNDRSRDNTLEAMQKLEGKIQESEYYLYMKSLQDGPASHMHSSEERKQRPEKSWSSRMRTLFWLHTHFINPGNCC